MIVWIELPLALALHDRQIAEHGGSAGVRDERLLQSALARPQQLYAYGDPLPDIADLAASLAFGIAKNHPFVDGNKRSAIVSCETFIEMNDVTLDASDADLYQAILFLAESKFTEKEFAAWLRAHIRVNPHGQVQEPKAKYKVRKSASKSVSR